MPVLAGRRKGKSEISAAAGVIIPPPAGVFKSGDPYWI